MRSHLGTICLWLLLAGCTSSGQVATQDPQVQRLLADGRYEWITIETANTRIHFPAGSYAQAQQSILPDRAEASLKAVLQRLQEPEYHGILHLFYVDGREDMADLTGSPVTGFAYHSDNAVLLVFNAEWRGFERHELTHIVTLGGWASPAGPAIVEGLATHVDGSCGGYDNGRLARTLLDTGALIPLETLVGQFRRQDDLIAYLQAASIVEFMVSRLGPSAVRLLWERDLAASPDALQRSPASFQKDFEGWLSSTYEPVPVGHWEAIRRGGCGIQVTE